MAKICCKIFSLVFPGLQALQKNSRPTSTPRNCRHLSPISLSRAQFFFTPIFCLLGRSKICCDTCSATGGARTRVQLRSTSARLCIELGALPVTIRVKSITGSLLILENLTVFSKRCFSDSSPRLATVESPFRGTNNA